MKRSPMPPRSAPLTRTPFRWRPRRDPVSKKTRRLVWERSGGRCEIGRVCGGMTLSPDNWDPAHRISRTVKAHVDRPCNILVACRFCHEWCHANPDLAREHGWMLLSNVARPDLRAVRIGGLYWFLDDVGGKDDVELEVRP